MRPSLIVRVLVIVLVLGSTAPISQNQENSRREGNWWKELDAAAKANYVVGFFDGMGLGNRFSFWEFKDDNQAAGKAVTSYSGYSETLSAFFRQFSINFCISSSGLPEI